MEISKNPRKNGWYSIYFRMTINIYIYVCVGFCWYLSWPLKLVQQFCGSRNWFFNRPFAPAPSPADRCQAAWSRISFHSSDSLRMPTGQTQRGPNGDPTGTQRGPNGDPTGTQRIRHWWAIPTDIQLIWLPKHFTVNLAVLPSSLSTWLREKNRSLTCENSRIQ